MARCAVRLPALSRPLRAGFFKLPLAKKLGSASGDIAAQCPYQNRVGMARCAVRIAERQRQAMLPRTHKKPSPRHHARSALAALTGGDIAARCPYQNRVGTVRRAVRCPALPRLPPDSRPSRWPKSGEAPAGTSQRNVPTKTR